MDARAIRDFNAEHCDSELRAMQFIAMMMQEIAAQLAEMNVNLKDVNVKIFND